MSGKTHSGWRHRARWTALGVGLALATAGCNVSATTTNNNGNCDVFSGAQNTQNCPQGQASGSASTVPGVPPSSSPASYESASSVANGTPLASYSFKYPLDYDAPIGVASPSQSEFNNENIGDLDLSDVAGPPTFFPLGSDRILSLSAGITPTYQACASDTLLISSVSGATGTVFCLVEPGKMVGVSVTSSGQGYQILSVVIWEYVS